MQIDCGRSLQDIQNRKPTGLVPQLLKIQRHRIRSEKSLELAFLCRLDSRSRGAKCSRPRVLRRIQGRSFQKHYIAVSYPWGFSSKNPVGGYKIELEGTNRWIPNAVHDAVLDRVMNYAVCHGIDLIWIDQECINQNDFDEKETAMQSMDLVYRSSHYPLGLLSVPIESQQQLDLFLSLLRGQFVKKEVLGRQELCIGADKALEVVMLLHWISSDPWWSRAWIFQEQYCSSMKMNILIPHCPRLNTRHAPNEFGIVPGELQVSLDNFRTQSTMFCLACRRRFGKRERLDLKCEQILENLGNYNLFNRRLPELGDGYMYKAMSSTIFADIGHQKMTVASDILAIAANCCDYSVRLNTTSLEKSDCSLSLCIIVLALLNGEIIRNDECDRSLLSRNVFEYMKHQSLDYSDLPVEGKELIFLNGCRFVNVELSPLGIITTGYLWELDEAIDPTTLIFSEPRPPPTLRWDFIKKKIAASLYRQGHEVLANDIHNYLNEDAASDRTNERPSKLYKDTMASAVVRAVKERTPIHLGRLQGSTTYHGIFIGASKPNRQAKPSWAFTAWHRAEPSAHDGSRDTNMEKFVSLAVELVDDGEQGTPRLTTNHWMNGLYFLSDCVESEVVFPWPSVFKNSWFGGEDAAGL